jgi:hypothetical protein
VRIILIERGLGRARQLLPRRPQTILQPHDILLIDVDWRTKRIDVAEFCERYGVELLPRTGRYFVDRSQASAWWRS